MNRTAFALALFSICTVATRYSEAEDAAIASPVKGIVSQVMVQKGDRVQRGQVLMRLDDRLAQIAVRIAEMKLAACEAELRAADATAKEASARLDRKRMLSKQGAISSEELAAAVLMEEKYRSETEAKRGHIGIARLELERARLRLQQHEIVAPEAGVVVDVLKQPGEGVRALEAVVRVRRGE